MLANMFVHKWMTESAYVCVHEVEGKEQDLYQWLLFGTLWLTWPNDKCSIPKLNDKASQETKYKRTSAMTNIHVMLSAWIPLL